MLMFVCVVQEKAGVSFLILHGCVECNKFVYVESDERKNCPYVKADGVVCGEPRYDSNGKPREVNIVLFLYLYLLSNCINSYYVINFHLAKFRESFTSRSSRN